MLIERLFSTGIMRMGPSRLDPDRQVGVFNPEAIRDLPAQRAAEMEKVAWLAGEWDFENSVPATSASPAYTDIGTGRYTLCDHKAWICQAAPDGRETPLITWDPFSRQWIYLLYRGGFGMLRSADGWRANQIAFTGLMTMLGINTDWRITWRRENENQFSFTNEEKAEDGSWVYIDEWRFRRKA